MKKITQELINKTSKEARLSERKRKNFNFHESLDDQLQRLLNALQPDTYVQPHKHESPDKREVFIILTGKVAVISFDNCGEVLEHIILDTVNGNFGVEIPEKTWHTVIALEKDSVLFEVKDGPYSPLSDKDFATWAPTEKDINCIEYNQQLLRKIGL